jgi:hypothetical protein
LQTFGNSSLAHLTGRQTLHVLSLFFYLFGFVRLLALRPLLTYCMPASGDNEDDCKEADGM